MIFNIAKVLLAILMAGIVTVVGGLFVFIYLLSGTFFTKQQCELVERNFDKLKVGMTREEVLPLIGGERGASVT